FAAGLPSFVMIKVFSPSFFAREDTKTPMWFAAVGMITNVVLSLALFPFLAHVGIAMATSVAGWANAGLLGITLWRRGELVPDAAVKRNLPLVLVASLAM